MKREGLGSDCGWDDRRPLELRHHLTRRSSTLVNTTTQRFYTFHLWSDFYSSASLLEGLLIDPLPYAMQETASRTP
jgi:hypothetical protein